jgi:hypothetical protein
MAGGVVILGVAFLLTGASLTHIGLKRLFDQGALDVPGWAIWSFSIAPSRANVFTK